MVGLVQGAAASRRSPMSRVPGLLFAFTSFVGAFLLFQVQLIVGKHILPWFGGSAAVWITSLVVFQCLLLAGYVYGHVTFRRLSHAAQTRVHVALLALGVAVIVLLTSRWPSAITPAGASRPALTGHPTAQVAGLVLLSAGFPFFLLSTTTPLLQAWFARLASGQQPYRLYAVSNLGSLLGLLSFPFFFEPVFSSSTQGKIWSALFCVFAGSCVLCSWVTSKAPAGASGIQLDETRPGAPVRALWFLLAACASALLLATTNLLCQEVISVPLLWVIPLSLYLLSFILCFDHPRWYRRAVFCPLFAVALFGTCASFITASFPGQLVAIPVVLFAACMVCHGELVRKKPEVRSLTSFYLAIAAGGAVGACFVALLAPRIFRSFAEFQWSLGLAVVLMLATLAGEGRLRSSLAQGLAVVIAVSAAVALYASNRGKGTLVTSARDFYGVIRVFRHARSLELVHGATSHGTQFDPPFERVPTSYYGRGSGVGVVMRNHPGRSAGAGRLRVGVVGLGVGTLAAYGRAGDSIRFYELDPEVARLASGPHPVFTYLRDSAATVSVVLGDARLSLEREVAEHGSPRFDVLVLDAFNGDSVPTHLLTREAFDLYWRALDADDGILAVHITSRHVELAPVLIGAAEHLHAAYQLTWNDAQGPVFASAWFLMARDPRLLQMEGVPPIAVQYHGLPPRLWTDDYSGIVGLIH